MIIGNDICWYSIWSNRFSRQLSSPAVQTDISTRYKDQRIVIRIRLERTERPPHTTSRRELIIISNPSSSSRRVERPEPQDSPQSTLSSETILCLEKIYLYLAFKRSRRSVVSCATPRNGEQRLELGSWGDQQLERCRPDIFRIIEMYNLTNHPDIQL